MPHFLVAIRGDPARAAGLLAVAGIQNLVTSDGIAARLRAADGEHAAERVQDALEGEPLTVGEARREAARRGSHPKP
jgi:hypothetical protein